MSTPPNHVQGELLPLPAAPPVDWNALYVRAGQVFKPGTPVDEEAMLQGRREEIARVVEAVIQPGRHAIIYGERGVGKTSLANVLEQAFLLLRKVQVVAPRVNCTGSGKFPSVWQMMFESIGKLETVPAVGFAAESIEQKSNAAALLAGREVTADTVRRVLGSLAEGMTPILIFDEFDRLPRKPRREFADLLKSLSDYGVRATVVLVGVADTVDQLVEEHGSIARSLVEIHLERMAHSEIRSIMQYGLKQLGMVASDGASRRVALLARGLPHYAHLLGMHSARAALAERTLTVTDAHVKSGIEQALKDAQRHIQTAYHTATTSPQKKNMYGDVLLACALARVDDMGTFAPQDLKKPLKVITGRELGIASFVQHLSDFSSDKRGHVLKRIGTAHRYRYRFVDSLMQPYVIMKGMATGRIPSGDLEEDV
jgi:Cdc6-like AAA superfamily ATPase